MDSGFTIVSKIDNNGVYGTGLPCRIETTASAVRPTWSNSHERQGCRNSKLQMVAIVDSETGSAFAALCLSFRRSSPRLERAAPCGPRHASQRIAFRQAALNTTPQSRQVKVWGSVHIPGKIASIWSL